MRKKEKTVITTAVRRCAWGILLIAAMFILFPSASVYAEDSSNQLHLSKEVDLDNSTGEYWLTLESYATGIDTSSSQPMDIVLVLDQSGSMSDPMQKIVSTQIIPGVNRTMRNLSDMYRAMGTNDRMIYELPGDPTTYEVEVRQGAFHLIGLYSDYSIHFKDTGVLIYEGRGPDNINQSQFPVGATLRIEEAVTAGQMSRNQALKNAANAFLQSVYANANAPDGVNHRVSIVGFAGGSGTSNPINTEVKTTKNISGNRVNTNYSTFYPTLNSTGINLLNGSFQSTRDADGGLAGRNILNAAINDLQYNGATRADLGMHMARMLLMNRPVPEQSRKSIVIFFTDGVPTTSNAFSAQVASDTIGHAYAIKQQLPAGHGESVIHSVGIFEGANVSSTTPLWNVSNFGNVNRFMHMVSSNHPFAGQGGANIEVNGNEGVRASGDHYHATSDADDLESIFTQIGQSVSDIHLDHTSMMRDTISDAFNFPEGSAINPGVQLPDGPALGASGWYTNLSANPIDIQIYTVAAISADATGENIVWSNTPQPMDVVLVDPSVFNPETDIDPLLTNTLYLAVNQSKKTIDVFGFDYTETYVVDSTVTNGTAKKLLVKIRIEPTQGGEDVYTNGEESGIYSLVDNEYRVYERFERPSVTINHMAYVLDYGKPMKVRLSEDLQVGDSQVYGYSISQGNPKKLSTVNLLGIVQELNKNYTVHERGQMQYGVLDVVASASQMNSTGERFIINTFATYHPTTMEWNGTDSLFMYLFFDNKTPFNTEDDVYDWAVASFIPATSVYYEEDFGILYTLDENDDLQIREGFTETIIQYTGTWVEAGTPSVSIDQVSGATNPVAYADRGELHGYGWDPMYEGETGDSMGTSMATTTAGSSATFNFFGTGFDLHARTDFTSGSVYAYVYRIDDSTGQKTLIGIYGVDNLLSGEEGEVANAGSLGEQVGGYVQIPVLSIHPGYGHYEVKIAVTGARQGRSNTFFLDGIRVYNPIKDEDSNANKNAQTAYNRDGEANAIDVKINDAVCLRSVTVVQSATGSVFLADSERTTGGEVGLDEIVNDQGDMGRDLLGSTGPNNEVYLAPGQSIQMVLHDRLYVSSEVDRTFRLGMKLPSYTDGSFVPMSVDVNGTDIEVLSAAELYYKIPIVTTIIDSFHVAVITITNPIENDRVLSLTRLRVTDSAPVSSVNMIPQIQNKIQVVDDPDLLSNNRVDMNAPDLAKIRLFVSLQMSLKAFFGK